MKNIIKKWYNKLGFLKSYDSEFELLLEKFNISLPENIKDYDNKTHTAEENLLAYLYYCESLQCWYNYNNIPKDVLFNTLSDIVIWTNVWFSIHGTLGVAESDWLKRHLSARLFRLGRLQFSFGEFKNDYTHISVKKGEKVIEVHIPADGKLTAEDCDESFMYAKQFFNKHFNDYDFKFYTCYSWLLDESIEKYLRANSNVSLFSRRFQKLESHKSDAIIKYVFRWDATRENLEQFETKTTLSKAIKEGVKNNESFFETYGFFLA